MNLTRQDIRRAINKQEAIEADLRSNNWQPVSPDAELANYQEAHDATLKVGEVAADLLYDLCTTVYGHVPVSDAELPKRADFTDKINELLSDALSAAETASEQLEREAA